MHIHHHSQQEDLFSQSSSNQQVFHEQRMRFLQSEEQISFFNERWQ